MDKHAFIGELQVTQKFFNKSIDCLTEADSTFKPKEAMYTVAQQIAHTAHTIEWFLEGAFSEKGFDMDFAAQAKEIVKFTSLEKACTFLNDAFKQAVDAFNEKDMQEWAKPITDPEILTGLPRFSIVSAIVDHTAHHRGSLAVYARMLGKTPSMPY
jgi:uncharacterized damage-inducible protein DinB